MARALRDSFFAEAHVRRVADTCVEMADGLSVNDSRSYKQKTTTSSDFMFHYPCLLAVVMLKDVEECRTAGAVVEIR